MEVSEPKNQAPVKTDLQIWSEIKKGDTVALGHLYDMYIDILFSYGIQHSKDRYYVKDCIHDLFLDLYKYRTKLAKTDNVKSYLFTSLRRKINKKYNRKILPLQADYLFGIDSLQENYASSCEEEIIRTEKAAETSAKLANALTSLTKKQKKGLFLRFNQDRSYEDIAEIMNISIPTVRTTIYRAVKMLRKQPLSILFLAPSFLFY